jgi:hypothetical protein
MFERFSRASYENFRKKTFPNGMDKLLRPMKKRLEKVY